ncbi:MAG: hypothetical protein SVX43_02725, partial [Cyanobacteriota bacterium]|nr:hypothetical protein [Cyanobacteriota bacterium]
MTMSQKTSFIQERELQVAERQIESFGQRFGTPHLVFASHAAFPLAVTPDLLYCLWANFGRDRQGQVLDIPWIAVADLLFSGLLSEVGYEIYQMDRIARNLLLQRLQDDNHFGQQRIGELAEFLLAYVQPQLKSNDPDLQDFALAQQWTALAYVQPFDAARRLAKTYQISLESGTELVRMESLVETLAEPLADYQPLLMYARSLGNYARGDNETAAAQLGGVPQKGNAIEVAGVRLPIPKPIQPPPRRWTRRKFLQVAGWTALAGGGAGAAFVLRQRAQRRTAQPKLLPVPTSMTLNSFQFDVPRVDAKGQVIQTSSRQARAFSHDLG